MTVGVELTRSVDVPEVLAAFAERGLAGQAADDGLGLLVDADDAVVVERTLEAWAGARGLPFVPVRLDATRYALVPPAG
jgi:hypothetical protein